MLPWNRIVTRRLLLLAALAPACGGEPATAPQPVGTELRASPVEGDLPDGSHARRCGQIEEFTIPTFQQGNIFPQEIVTAPDGKLWFTTGLPFLGRFSPDTRGTSLVPIPNVASRIAFGPDGNIWFGTDTGVARLTRRHDVVREIPIPGLGFVADIAAGPDGTMWALGFQNIARIAADGRTTLFPVPDNFASSGDRLVAGPDGNLWFARGPISALALYRVTRRGAITSFPVTTPGQIFDLAVGPDGTIWYTQGGGLPNQNRIGRITADGLTSTIVQLPDSTTTQPDPPSNMPVVITKGPHGKMYFTTYFVEPKNYIGQVTPQGELKTFDIPTGGAASFGITTGPDGNIWFTENFNNLIGRLNLRSCHHGRTEQTE